MTIFIQRVFLSLLSFLCIAFACFSDVQAQDNPLDNSDGIQKVLVGGYINEIHAVDLTSHSYPGDIYIWFRWMDPEMRPNETFEFMNFHDPEAHIQSVTYDEPEVMEADGSFYQVIRHQGAFSTSMPLSKYPFDTQVLKFIIEDAEFGDEELRYVADPDGVTINDELTLPGYRIGEPRMRIYGKSYPTTFGDLNNPETAAYSRVVFEVPITRPWQYGVLKLFLPVLIILMCAGLALMIDPTHTEGRIGLVITALLTLVAMQITTAGSLPEVSYLMLLDYVYLLSYAFILVMMARVAYGSWQDAEDEIKISVRNDKRVLITATAIYFVGVVGTVIFVLSA
ncbi:hypothetical protein ACJ3XI_02710 [Litorimonas sp. RW-G-Af-16]|uniref:hypothetical protein n=1 Tax=Litorimonas sp. RW-G-Af-16 TaxID=3241168 RepID=UPI00390C4956